MGSSSSSSLIVIVLLLWCIVANVSNAQTCTNFLTLADCIPAATGSGTPPSSCCKKIAAYKGKPACLCQLLLASKKAIPSINLANAVKLPKKCRLSKFIPKNYKCGGVLIPSLD